MIARAVAFKILKRVFFDQAHASLLLRQLPPELSGRDQALVNTLVYGTIKNQRYLRYQWEHLVQTLPDPAVCLLLDLSLFQELFLAKIPSYALVNEAIELSKKEAGGRYRKLVTAVLHQAIQQGEKVPALLANLQQAYQNKQEKIDLALIETLALVTSHPLWLVQLWLAQLGFLKTYDLCYFNNTIASLELRLNPFKTSWENLASDENFQKNPAAKFALSYQGNVLTTDYFKQRQVVIQSVSSQQVVEAFDLAPEQRYLDLCSAPGGKALLLASLEPKLAEIVAVDIYPARVKLIQQEMKRQGITNIKTLVADATELSETELGLFAGVLLDAPCSGLGVLRHKPEIKWRLTPTALDELEILQARLLTKAAQFVAPGGQLVYATCTINQKENERQIKRFLAEQPNFTLVFEKNLFPPVVASDGFYLAKLLRQN